MERDEALRIWDLFDQIGETVHAGASVRLLLGTLRWPREHRDYENLSIPRKNPENRDHESTAITKTFLFREKTPKIGIFRKNAHRNRNCHFYGSPQFYSELFRNILTGAKTYILELARKEK